MGIVGMTLTLAIEGAKRNIYVNALAPLASTNMTKGLLSKNSISVKYVTPVVMYLCSKECTLSGKIFEASGGFICETRIE